MGRCVARLYFAFKMGLRFEGMNALDRSAAIFDSNPVAVLAPLPVRNMRQFAGIRSAFALVEVVGPADALVRVIAEVVALAGIQVTLDHHINLALLSVNDFQLFVATAAPLAQVDVVVTILSQFLLETLRWRYAMLIFYNGEGIAWRTIFAVPGCAHHSREHEDSKE